MRLRSANIQAKEKVVPGNTIKINGSDDLEWYVGDSKMDDLIEWLKDNGYRMNRKISPSKRCINTNKNKVKRKR
jgi:hypothetical protein